MSNNDNFNESNYFNKSIESTQSKESKNYKKSAAYKFAVGVLALSLTVGTLTGCGGDKINATEVNPTQVEDYTEADSTDEAESTNETASAVFPDETISTPETTTTETTTSGVITTETNPTEVIVNTEQNLESMYTFDYIIPTKDDLVVPSRFSNGEMVDYTRAPISATESYNFQYLNPEQQAEIKKMADMSVEDFRALPQEEQLTYAFWLFENSYQRLEAVFDACEIDRDYKWEIKDAYDIVNNYACNEIFWRTLRIRDNPNDEGYDFDAMRKFGSLLFKPEFLAEHDTLVEQIKTNGSTPDDFKIKLTEADYLAEHTLPLIENVDVIPVAVEIEPSELVGGGGLYFYDFERVYFTTITGEETSAFIITSVTSRK